MKLLYDVFFVIFGILYLPFMLFRRKLHGGFVQKLGVLPRRAAELDRPVWIHAVSVGEAALACKVAFAIRSRYPDLPIAVSTTTATGNGMVRRSGYLDSSSGKGPVIDMLFYYPFDISCIVSRVLRILRPRLYMMVETELWPNLLKGMKESDIPVALVNGRISDASYRNYTRIKFFTKKILSDISLFCMQSSADASRIKDLGAHPSAVHVTGNMKFDETPRSLSGARLTRRSLGIGENENVFVAGSTHPGEEKEVIEACRSLSEAGYKVKLILAPRHIERSEALKVYIAREGFKYVTMSGILAADVPSEGYDVLLVDTIGHLKDLYSVATVVFIGGSIAKKGGQNPIEAACWGKPLMFGPHMDNFREVSEIFLNNKAAVKVACAEDIVRVLRDMIEDPRFSDKMSDNALRVIKENTGAVDSTVALVEGYLKGRR